MTTITDRFAGKTAIVTGAGAGIGRATALRLIAEGARVVAADISAARLSDLRAGAGDRLVAVEGDLAAEETIGRIVAAAGDRIDILVNNAGIMDGFEPLGEVTDAVWDRVFAVNLTAPMRLSRAVLPVMVAAGKGAIVNVASEAGLRGACAGVAYTASKHAMIGMTRNTAFMYAGLGIRVNAVAPGPVQTAIEATFNSQLGAQRLGPLMQVIVPPVAQPEQLASTILYLASDEASNVTGAVLPSDGGWSAI